MAELLVVAVTMATMAVGNLLLLIVYVDDEGEQLMRMDPI